MSLRLVSILRLMTGMIVMMVGSVGDVRQVVGEEREEVARCQTLATPDTH